MEKIVYELKKINLAANFILKYRKSNVICFYGSMGSGKTTLIIEILNLLGIKDYSKSPSFDIVREYFDSLNGVKVFHFDFYRIESVDEALDLGFEEYLTSNDFVFIEWPNKIECLLPFPRTEVFMQSTGLNTRQINLKNLME